MAFDHIFKAGATSKIIEVMLRDSTTGAGKTGVAYGSVSASYCRSGATRQAITLAAGTAGDAYSSGKWAEVDSTNQKGLYQLHIPDAAIAAAADAVSISLQATGVLDRLVRVVLPAADLYDAAGLGLSRFDAAISTRSTYAGGAVASVTAAVTLTAGEHTNIAADAQTGLTAQGYTAARAAKLDNADAAVSAVKAKTDNLPASPAASSDIQTGLTAQGYTTTRAGYLDVLNGIVAAVWASAGRTLSAFAFTVATASDAGVTAIKAKTDNLPAAPAAVSDIPTAAANAAGLLDAANGVEASWTLRQALRVWLAALCGKADGAATATMHFRDQADGKNRITATVDASGNRTAVGFDLT